MLEREHHVRADDFGEDEVIVTHPANDLASLGRGLSDPTGNVLQVVDVRGLTTDCLQPHSPNDCTLRQPTVNFLVHLFSPVRALRLL